MSNGGYTFWPRAPSPSSISQWSKPHKALDVLCMHTFQNIRKGSLIQKQSNVFCFWLQKTETKGYRLYDTVNSRLIYSHDVKFNEREFDISKRASE